MRYVASLVAVVGLAAASASASPVFYSVDSGKTSSTLHGGDRELNSIGFSGNSTIWDGTHFLNFRDGSLTNNIGTYGWNASIPRDMSVSGNGMSANPDRADAATAFVSESSHAGTLREVFSSFRGYKNMSYLIDGEDTGAYTLDLRFQSGLVLNSDANPGTIELTILERGGNSDLQIQGILANGSLTSPILMSRTVTGETGWTLDSMEIDGAQPVKGVGISLDPSWTGLAGFRFTATSSMNGPDIVAVGTTCPTPTPTPGTLAIGSLGGILLGRRSRR